MHRCTLVISAMFAASKRNLLIAQDNQIFYTAGPFYVGLRTRTKEITVRATGAGAGFLPRFLEAAENAWDFPKSSVRYVSSDEVSITYENDYKILENYIKYNVVML